MKRFVSLMLVLLAVQNAAPRLAYGEEAETVAAPTQQQAADTSWQSRLNAEKSKVLGNAAGGEAAAEDGIPYVKVLEGLGYCLAVFLIGFHIFKKFHSRVNGLTQRNLRLLETIPLAPKTFLHLVEVNQQKFVVSSGQQTVSFMKLDDAASFRMEDLEAFAQAGLKAESPDRISQDKLC